MPRPRFTVRWLMAAVAIVAMGCFALVLWKRRADFQQRSLLHVTENLRYGIAADQLRKRPIAAFLPPSTPALKLADIRARDVELKSPMIQSCQARSDYHRTLAEKYARGAVYPWLPVAPDPPEPPVPTLPDELKPE